jgi:hypothetical protein
MNQPAPTPTPRTDAYEYKAGWAAANYGEPWKPMDFARTLEREVAALTAERDLFRAEATWWKNLHKKSEDDEISVEVKTHINQLRAAELAAERALYQELLLQVGSKCNGETLHQTALRRLRSAAIDAAMKEGA